MEELEDGEQARKKSALGPPIQFGGGGGFLSLDWIWQVEQLNRDQLRLSQMDAAYA